MFWTDEKVSLITKGPANMPKHGIQSLEGVIETDWLPILHHELKMTARIPRPFERRRADRPDHSLSGRHDQRREPEIRMLTMETNPELYVRLRRLSQKARRL